ncbi:MAG: hypothetical protein JWQ51_3216 [Tardiphaga sp.]|nr:hypothetical protein [Tardiphaga sp.]
MAIQTLASAPGPRKPAAEGQCVTDLIEYAYKASLVSRAETFALTPEGLSWRVRGRGGVWPYAEIVSIRLSYRPVSMQARRFRADIKHVKGMSLTIVSTSWQTASLMTTQDDSYRAFIVALHRRMAEAGSTASLRGGLRPSVYRIACGLLAIVAVMMTALLLRALWLGEWPGALFLIGFGALFAWQTGGFVWRNTPRTYTFERLPVELLP